MSEISLESSNSQKMKGQYRQLLEDPDVDADNEQILARKRRSMRQSALIHWTGHFSSLIVLIILVVLNAVQRDQYVTKEFRTTRLYEPLQSIVRYSTKTYDHVMFHPDEERSIFQGDSRPELDKAWAHIMNHSLILITEEDMKRLNEPTQNAYTHNGKYFALIDGFHQLHCVDLIRKYVYRESYPEYIAFHDKEETILYHVDHCLDVLRQKIMCDTDVDLIVYNKPRMRGGNPEARFAYPRLCRNFDEIRQWTWSNGLNDDEVKK